MLLIYRRHRRRCKHNREGRQYRHCECPIHIDGFLAGRRLRQTLGTRNWTRAKEIERDWEIAGRIVEEEKPQSLTTVADACKAFLVDAKARNLRPATLYKYDLLFRQLQTFADKAGLTVINKLISTRCVVFANHGQTRISQARRSWKLSALFFSSAGKAVGSLRTRQ